MRTKSEYVRGKSEWPDMVSKCTICGEIVLRQECNMDGIPVRTVLDNTETHRCKLEENKNDNGTI
jgi:hypothetical protein